MTVLVLQTDDMKTGWRKGKNRGYNGHSQTNIKEIKEPVILIRNLKFKIKLVDLAVCNSSYFS